MSEEVKDPTVIDANDLVNEWKFQGKLRRESGKDLADAQEELRNKKTYYKWKRSEIALEYRKGAKQMLGADDKPIKITDKAIADLLDSDAELREIDNEINKLQRDVDICSGFVEAINTKKYGLQEVGALWRSEYWSDPRMPSEERYQYMEAYEEEEKKYTKEEEVDEIKRRRKTRKESN